MKTTPVRLFLASLAVVLTGAGAPHAAAAMQNDADPVGIIERASREYVSLNSFCAQFQQTLSVPLLAQVTRSSGRMCQQQPDLFSMHFSDPDGDLVVADGDWLWIYFPSTDAKQVIRSPMTAGQPGRFDFHREFLADPGTKYDPAYAGREMLDGAWTHQIRLLPTQPSAYREARVWIDERVWLIRRVEIEEENGNVREVALAELERNPRLAPSSFQFTPPPGVQIITR